MEGVVNWLNGHPPTDVNATTKSDISELLSVTDAAVQALQKSKTSSKSSGSVSIKHVLSPTVSGFIPPPDSVDSQSKKDSISVHSSGSKSTSPSDVLIRSTLMDTSHSQHVLDFNPASDASIHNSSVLSKASSSRSAVSGASSTFLTGAAKPVKVSSRKLKEIKSPFQDDGTNVKGDKLGASNASTLSALSEVVNGDKVTEDKRTAVPHSQVANDKNKLEKRKHYTNVSDQTLIKNNTKNIMVERHYSQPQTDATLQSPRTSSTGDTDDKVLSSARPMLDSGYMTQNVQVIREMQEEVQQLGPQGSESGDSMIQTIGHVTQSSASDASTCTQPDIVTVPETIVTVNAKHSLESGSDQNSSVNTQSSASTGTEQARAQLGHRFNKYHLSGLKQGSLTNDTSLASTAQQAHREEVKVSQFGLSHKQRLLKENFLKKQQSGSGAVKRLVQPKLVQPEIKSNSAALQQQQQQTATDAATTAAVAAASAVAATQPFLKAQHEMETRMAQILERLSALPQKGAPPAPGSESDVKILELEQQVKELTQQRLTHLEQLQHRQMEMQAHLIAVSRERPPPDQYIAPPGDYYDSSKQLHYTPPEKPSRAKYQKAVTHAVLPGDERHSVKFQQQRGGEGATGMLDTPAPRRRPPLPTAYSDTSQRSEVTPEKKPKKGTLLAEILASQDETPQSSPFPDTPPNSRDHSYGRHRDELSPKTLSTMRQAHQLVQDLGSLKNQMQHTLADVSQWKDAPQKTVPSRYTITAEQPLIAEKHKFEVAPLDVYMQQPKDVPPASPYPSLKSDRKGVATEAGKYREAEDTLQRVQTTRNFLETNLDLIMKGRHDSEVYSFIDQLTRDSSLVEKLRIKQLVDENIKSMSADLEREVFDELLKLEQQQKVGFLIPERDVTGPKVKGQVKPGVRGKGKVEARINTGLRKPKEKETAVTMRKAKKPAKAVNLQDNEAYMQRVYGKAAYHPQRNTQKDPYLRYQSIPKSQLPQPGAPKPILVKGVEMSTTKTQTTPADNIPKMAPQEHFYFDPSIVGGQHPQHGMLGQPMQGQLIPMAIPLGAPRKEGGLPPPSATPQQPITSTPLHGGRAPTNVAMVKIRDEGLDEPSPCGILVKRPVPKLTAQVLPPVNIDSVTLSPSVSSSTRSKVTVLAQVSPKDIAAPSGVVDVVIAEGEDLNGQEVDEYSEEESEDGTGIALPGYKPRPSHYHGPQFPPQAPPLVPKETSSDVLAADIRRRDVLQNKAVDWVEQELMARMISEYYASRPEDPIPHALPTPAKPAREVDSDLTESFSDVSAHDTLIAETLGQDGVQFFVDAGQPVDEKLVNALIKEAIVEKMRSLVGQPTSVETEEMKHVAPTSPRPRPSPRHTPRYTTAPRRVDPESPPMMPSTPVPTPEPTPKATPVHSPPRRVSPPQTPDLTPLPSEAGEPQVVVAAVVRDDTETESDEITIGVDAPAALPRDVEEEIPESFTSRHDVFTPTATPPRSPLIHTRTPSPSIQEEPVVVHVPPPTPPATPQPWADPASPPPEDNPEYESSVTDRPEVSETPSPEVRPRTPSLRERQVSVSTVESSPLSSVLSDTANEHFSEGQWLLSVRSEGEVPVQHMDPDLEGRLRHHLLHPRAYREEGDDTLHGTEELEEEEYPSQSHSEGEVLHPRGMVPPDSDPVLAILAKLRQQQADAPALVEYPLPYNAGRELGAGVDKSLGEVSMGQRPPLDTAAETAMRGGAVETPGEGAGRRDQAEQDVEPTSRFENGAVGTVLSSESPVQPPSSPSVITVRPRTPTQEGDAYKRTGGRRSHPTLGAPVLTASGRPQTRRGPSGAQGRGRPPYSPSASFDDDRPFGGTGDSQNGYMATGTMSDLGTRTMTPDQMNVEALLQSRDYFTNTQSETTGEFIQSGRMTQSDFSQSGTLTQSGVRRSEEFGRGGQMGYSMGTTSDMSLPAGMTRTLEGGLRQSERFTYTLESDSDFRTSSRYPDSLDGTGDFGQMLNGTGRQYPAEGTRQVSVTIPSVAEEDSDSEDRDVSEFSLGYK